MNRKHVTVSKPKKGGAAFRAPLGTTLPTDAQAALDAALKNLGYISEDGLTNANSPSRESIKAWGGDEVVYHSGKKSDTFKFTLLEALNPEVLKAVYVDENVEGTLDTGISVAVNNAEQADCAWVFDMVLKDGVAKRIVIPCASVITIEEIVYKDNAAVGYGVTIAALPDDKGNTHYEYMISKAKGAT